MLDAGFPVLARMKGLRGSPLDIFGMSEERKMERGLIKDYEAALARIVSGLTAERLPTAIQIAAIPQKIRGYGHVKDASVGPAKAEEKALWGRWEKQGEKVLETA
jgi:indolepyruvate ferredoxin oxidoreductase